MDTMDKTTLGTLLAVAMLLLTALPAAHAGVLPAADDGPADDAADADPPAGYPDGSYVTDEGAIAVPLRQDPPDWLTPELRQKAHDAAQEGLAVDIDTGDAVPLASQYALIRPGAWMIFPFWCTMAFVSGSPGSYEIWTAGHCLEGGGEVIVVAAPSLIFAIGKGNGPAGAVGNDYGKVRIYDQWQPFVDPDTAVIGGPGPGLPGEDCAVFDGTASATNPVPVKHFGHGIAIGTGGTPRAGVSLHANNNDPLIDGGFSNKAVYWDGAAAPGDSGSPVLSTNNPLCPLGEGLAILTHLVIIGPNLQYIAGTNVAKVGTPAEGNGLPV